MEPYDEPEIVDADTLIRRVNPKEHIVPDKNRGGDRISSKLFSASPGMSVDILKLIEQEGIDAREFVTTPVFTGAVAFCAGIARSVGLRVGYEPIINQPPLPNNPYHGEVWCEVGSTRLKKTQVNAIWDACDWFVELPGVHLHRE